MVYSAIDFLLNTIFGILTMMFLLRFFMQLFRTSFNNPIGQMVITLTDFAVKPTRKIIPSLGKIDLSTLLLAIFSQFLLQFIVFSMHGNVLFATSWGIYIVASLLGVVRAVLDLFFYTILLQCILSWVNPHTPIAPVINSLTRPILAPIQRILPITNGIDFSPIVALILIQLINVSVVATLSRNLLSIF
jgi:YggT family protein